MEPVRGDSGLAPDVNDHLELVDYRRRVFDMYRAVRDGTGVDAWREWVTARNDLFATHSQSPIEDKSSFTGLSYFEYNPKLRVTATVSGSEGASRDIGHSGTGATRFVEVGISRFSLDGRDHSLSVLWLDAYGGGLFLPFRDSTNGHTTYGGGRYLLDTVKGADLGRAGNDLVLDFNYAYHPSCVHSERWSCPLAPVANRLEVPIDAGERL